MGRSSLILFAVLSFNQLLVRGLPSGPPSAACRNLVPQHGSAPQDVGFQIISNNGPTFVPGGPPVVVTLVGTSQYRGIFLQVRDGSNLTDSSAVGSWEASISNFFGIVDCSSVGFPPNSALGHTSRQLKGAGQGFQWTPPDNCRDGEAFFVRATVVVSRPRYQTGLRLRLTCTNPSTTPSITVQPAATTPGPPPTIPPMSTPTPTETLSPEITTPMTGTTPPVSPTSPISPPEQTCQFSGFDSIPADYSNSFENSSDIFRGWLTLSNPSNSSYRWVTRRGPTPTIATGPPEALDGRRYIFTESSAPAENGDEAVLVSRRDLRGCFCFRFAYHFDVTEVGHTLTVVMGNVPLGTLTTRSPDWVDASIPVDTPNFVQIQIIGRRGRNWLGDIGLDNVSIEPGLC